jgi:hypothetical protein
MENQPSSKQLDKDGDKQALGITERIKSPISGEAQQGSNRATQGQITNLEGRLRSAEKWMIWLTAAIAFFAFCSVIVGALQWSVINRGSADTHALAEAAKTQAQKMGDMSDAAEKIRQAAQNMVTQEQRIAENAQKSLEASNTQSQKALNANIAASRLDQRAWVGLKFYQCVGCTKTNGVITYGNLIAVLENTGKTPAIEMHIDQYESLGHKMEEPIPDIDTVIEQQKANFGKNFSEIPKVFREMYEREEVLAPNATKTMSLISGDKYGTPGVLNSDFRNYVLVKITYRIEGDKREHFTKFCLMNQPGDYANFEFCPTGQAMN